MKERQTPPDARTCTYTEIHKQGRLPWSITLMSGLHAYVHVQREQTALAKRGIKCSVLAVPDGEPCGYLINKLHGAHVVHACAPINENDADGEERRHTYTNNFEAD